MIEFVDSFAEDYEGAFPVVELLVREDETPHLAEVAAEVPSKRAMEQILNAFVLRDEAPKIGAGVVSYFRQRPVIDQVPDDSETFKFFEQVI